MDKPTEQGLSRLIEILDRLRVECPWDRAQTMVSLRKNTIEEVCELIEAIGEVDSEGGPEHVREELGDLLLHVMFYSKIASEKGWFTLADVAEGVADKLVYRHPHVFGEVEADDVDAVLRNWDALKAAEGRKKRSRFQKFLRRVKYGWKLVVNG